MKDAGSVRGTRIEPLRRELARQIAFFASGGERVTTAVPGLLLVRRTQPTAPTPACYEPSLALVAQGRKELELPGRRLFYDESHFLITSLDMPVLSRVVEASPERPYLCMLLRLEMPVVREMLAQGEIPAPAAPPDADAMAVGEATEELLDACCRLLRLLEKPAEIPFLAGLLQREIIYRILQTPAGARLREIATMGTHGQRIGRVIEWLRRNYEKPVRVEELARMAAMGVSTFHHHFRELTAMSPLQYVKQLRLQAARQKMLSEGLDASSAAYAVGYQSASQFSREYKRYFGVPPSLHLRSVRRAAVSGRRGLAVAR
ncbi:MAG: AraC family transcriptional regulator [Bryobacteraceae bacterium]|nr:AraC family transcriptional regulator [Bryobacteraceae bacterium]